MKMIKGLVFDIQRFSTHDGDGIRTTVFLKGCPLHCVWCQNPEGISPEKKLVYFPNKCIFCASCLQIADKAIEISGKKLILLQAKVKNGERYEEICPTGALKMDSREYSIEEVLEIVMSDQAFFVHGGGVTLSGGEPFFQKQFTLELLKNLQKNHIHTAVETSLFVDQDYLLQVLPYIDTLFADLKVFDAARHQKITSVNPERIQDNIKYVLQSPHRNKVVIRTPLIPEYTAFSENIRQICRYITDIFPDVKYELLNYNPLAKAKYEHVEDSYCFEDNHPLYSASEMNDFYAMAYQAGIKNLIV